MVGGDAMFSSFSRRGAVSQTKSRLHAEPSPLKPELFGTVGKPKFGLKGGDTHVFLEHLVEIFPSKLVYLGDAGQATHEAGTSLLELLCLIRTYPKRFPPSAIQSFHRHSKSYLEKMELLEVMPKPKDHMLQEIAIRIPYLGSPKLYVNWHDEGLLAYCEMLQVERMQACMAAEFWSSSQKLTTTTEKA